MSRLDEAVSQGRADGKLALYFGCWETTGHYLHRPGGHTVWNPKRDVPGFPWSEVHIDAGLLKNGKHADVYDGKVFSTCGGLSFWWAFFWWDNSVDRRGRSNSGLYVRGFGFDEREDAFAYAGEQFPRVIARQAHSLILQPLPPPPTTPTPRLNMGELKPCPFCGFRMIASDALRTRNRTVYVHEAHEGECPAMNVILHSDNQARITAWNTRPRTEGRGEQIAESANCSGEPVAWRCFDLIMGTTSIIDDAKHAAQRRERASEWTVQPLYASPIREPEISREAVQLLRESLQVLENACEQLARERSTRTYISMLDDGSTDTLIALDNARRGARDAILNLAPVGGRGEEGSAGSDLSPASRSPDQHSAGGEG